MSSGWATTTSTAEANDDAKKGADPPDSKSNDNPFGAVSSSSWGTAKEEKKESDGKSGGTDSGNAAGFSMNSWANSSNDDKKDADQKGAAAASSSSSWARTSGGGDSAFTVNLGQSGGTGTGSNPASSSSGSQSNDGSNPSQGQQQQQQQQQQAMEKPEDKFNGYSVAQILSEWESKLEEHVNGYIQHGDQIRHWDQKLFENQSSIRTLQRDVSHLVHSQHIFNTNLEKIRAQQINLSAIIESLEKELQTTSVKASPLPGGGPFEKGQNVTREGVYKLAETIDQNLNSLNERLQAKIGELNKAQQDFKDNKHPLTPVVDILNNHLTSLEWIDSKTNLITERLGEMQRHLPGQ